MMKRKLPQWLLDATNNNNKEKSAKTNSDRDSQQDQHSIPINAQSDRITNNGTINVVPLANLLSSSHGGCRINETHTSNGRDKDDAFRPTGPSSTETVIKEENCDPILPSSASNPRNDVVVKQEIKQEPVDTATSNVITPLLTPPKVEDVKPERRSCQFGIKCFRRNPDHRAELAHPGDVDYRRPNLPNAPIGTPQCPWGAACYRRNPQHFIQLSHPPDCVYNPTASTATTVNNVPQLNPSQRRNRNTNGNNRNVVHDDDGDDSDAEDDYDLGDPFIDNGSSDEYVPEGDDDSEDDDEESQELIGT